MAQAMNDKSEFDLNFLTDCMYFINGNCKLEEKCRFRHCHEAVQQINNCSKWPKKCRNVTCPYRHPTIGHRLERKKPPIAQALLNHPCQPPAPTIRREGFVSLFWDIENVPIPRGQRPFDIVQRIRQKLVIEPGLQEVDFSCYCNINTIPQENQHSLQLAAVRLIHVPDRKPGAADRQIMLDLDRFERVHRPPATIVLISGDIDFVGKLSDLRHHARFHVVVIHNKPAKEELKGTVNEHYPWEFFTQQQQQQQPTNVINGLNLIGNERNPRTAEQRRTRHPSVGNVVRRRDPSPMRPFLPNRQQPVINNPDVKKYQCPVCQSDFESVQALRQHQTAKKHLLYCPVCNEDFVTVEGRNQHQKDKRHYVLDYKCDQCNKFFTKIESLNQHQQATGHMLAAAAAAPVPAPTSVQNDQDPIDVILNGIEAIKQHYEKRRLKND
jgi:hypothetical protein